MTWGYGRCGPNCLHPDCDCKPEWWPQENGLERVARSATGDGYGETEKRLMRFDKHHITCNIYTEKGSTHGAACVDGKVQPLWDRAKEGISKDDKIVGWGFWVTLRRGPIEIQAHGDENYTTVLQRAERILLAAEAAWSREHGEPSVDAD